MKPNNNPNEHWKVLVLILKNIADQKNISHQYIADQADVQRTTVTRMFNLKYCPSLELFIRVAQALKVNFFFQDLEDTSDLNTAFNQAMDQLGRRPDNLPKN
jgi:DNA-binding phage protein